MKTKSRYLIFLLILGTAISPVSAQIDTIVRALVDHAAKPPAPAPAQQPQQQPRRSQTQTTRQTNPREPSTTRQSKKPFDGTWLATQSKVNSDNQQMVTRTFTLVIKDGKATRTLDTTNASSPDKPFYGSVYEMQRRWTYNSVDCTEQGASLTIQWSPGQLSDWTPKTIPNPVVEGFGNPGAETSVYKLKGDELTRINDPNGLVYKRAK